MANTTKENLMNQVFNINDDINKAIEENTLYEYICESLEIEFISNVSREFLGGIITIALGGPTIYINTRKRLIEGFFGADNFNLPLDNETINELNNVLEELFYI